ncbi:MAG: glucose-1-phosphate thymidylyltransferase RfbA [Pseudomonadota bacterium]
MKGIILAGGSGTRLYPLTRGVSKQMLAIYDKPMIYYPLSVLMLAGIRDILVITTPQDQAAFQRLLGDGSAIGLNLSYAIQPAPEGLAQAFIIGETFIDGDRCALVLGDNIFYGHGLSDMLQSSARLTEGAHIFAYRVRDPSAYGVIELSVAGQVISIEEKPDQPRSSFAATGLYFYDHTVCDRARAVQPSVRGELEITTLNQMYMADGLLTARMMGRGYAWLDTGTPDAMLKAAHFVQSIEERQGLKIACLEEIALRLSYITPSELEALASAYGHTDYGKYLLSVAEEHD